MHTIIGSGGSIGVELAKALTAYTKDIRLVSRHPQKVNETDELVSADVLKNDQLRQAVAGSEVVYMTVGFAYRYKVWKANWPSFVRNLIQICKEEDSKLVFFDNIYMYDEDHLDGMTETTPVDPPSNKGKIRAEVARLIMDEIKSGSLQALIARSADFYGPHIEKNSALIETVFKPLSEGKKANLLGSDKYKHSFTYTPDAGKATAILGNTDEAYGQVWHLPTASNPLTGKEWVEAVASQMGVRPKYRVASKFLIKVMGLVSSFMRENVEMMYQYDRDYVFDSSKFEHTFNFTPTTYYEGMRQVIEADFRQGLKGEQQQQRKAS